MDRGAYPGCNHDSFPAKGSLDIKVGSALNNAKYHADKDQRACDAEFFDRLNRKTVKNIFSIFNSFYYGFRRNFSSEQIQNLILQEPAF